MTAPPDAKGALPDDPGLDDPTFVPAEERVWGLDRRTFAWAGAVIVIFLIAVLVLPAVNAQVDAGDVTTDGEVLVLAGAGALTVEAPGGWTLTGFRVGDEASVAVPSKTTLSKGGVQVVIRVAKFGGTASDLIDRIEDLNDRQDDPMGVGSLSQRVDATVGAGTPAVVKVYTGLDRKGIVIAFVETLADGSKVGVEVTAFGSADDMTAQLPAILAMIDTTTVGAAAPGTIGAGS